MGKVGFMGGNRVEVGIDKVERVGIDEGIVGGMFKYGCMVIKGSGGRKSGIGKMKGGMELRWIVKNDMEEMNCKEE